MIWCENECMYTIIGEWNGIAEAQQHYPFMILIILLTMIMMLMLIMKYDYDDTSYNNNPVPTPLLYSPLLIKCMHRRARINRWISTPSGTYLDVVFVVDEWCHEEAKEGKSRWMDVWIEGRMDGWMDVNEWMNEWKDGWINWWMNGWMNEWYRWMNGWMLDLIGWYQLLKWYQITINVIPYFWGIKTIRVYYTTRAFTTLH